jgi:hypothetical protein
LALAILIAGAAIPVWIAGISARAPQTRDIHIEAYRYGFSPARIRANRGDRLRLTFSTRDTGQSFFLQDYDLHASITPGNKTESVQWLSRPDDPPVLMETVEVVAGLPGWQGWLVSKSQFRNHTYNGPLHGTERGELIVGPNFLLYGALGLLVAMPFAGLLVTGRRSASGSLRRPLNLFRLFPWLKRVLKTPSFQFNLTLPMLGGFWLIILTGLFGTKVAGRNAGPMIIWVLWLSALIILLVPIGGRVWCTVCPLPLLGEWLQRLRLARNPAELEHKSPRRIFGVPLIWPAWLSNAWPRVLFFLLLGTFSTTIVALPPATSWMLIGLVILAIATSVFPEQRLFCRYLYPINSYISLYSTTGRVTVRSVSSQACSACTEKFCLTGSVKGWGCPYGLCVGEVDRNNDCGACMECVKTCAYDNVAVFWQRRMGQGYRQLRRGLAGNGDVCPGVPVQHHQPGGMGQNPGLDRRHRQEELGDVFRLRGGGVGGMPWCTAGLVVSIDAARDRDQQIASGREFPVSGNQRRAYTHRPGLLDRLCAGDCAFDDDLPAPKPVGPVQLGVGSSGNGG